MEDDDFSDAFLVFYFAFYIAPRCRWTWSYNDDVIIGVHIASREICFCGMESINKLATKSQEGDLHISSSGIFGGNRQILIVIINCNLMPVMKMSSAQKTKQKTGAYKPR